jgi:hypothetical protein
MRQDNKNFDYVDAREVNWSTVVSGDMVLVQRPFRDEHWQIVDLCKKWGVPVVADFDDLLSDLATSNPAFEAFHKHRETFIKIVQNCSGITVATEHLQTMIKSYGATCPTRVIPNSYDSRLFPYTSNIIERNKIMLWRGGNSHVEDLQSIKNEHEQLIADFPDWNFVFIAQDPWWLTKRENIKYIGGMGIIEYMRSIHDMAPAIMYHPLTDTDFNRSKSMCSWLEAAHARAAFIGPSFEEFNRPGIHQYKQGTFYETASRLMNNTDMIRESILSARSYVAENLELAKVNKLRKAFYHEIINHG